MLSIKVLGPGCPNCERLELHAIQAVDRLHHARPEVEATVEKVTDTMKFIDYGLLSTPGLVVNEKLVSSGRIPAPSQIIGWLEDALKG
jgi:hypothetical protein